MKNLSVASKALTVLFAAAFLAACSGNKEKEQAEAEAAAQRAAEEAARQAAMEQQAAEEARIQQLQAAVDAAGNVLYFAFDSYTLSADATAALDTHIALLQTNDVKVRLEGHTDERGTREYNMALGERRANAVRDYMTINGIASYRIETVSYGEEQPAAYGSGESNWSQNRRVVIKYQ